MVTKINEYNNFGKTKYSYPQSDEYEYMTILERLDLDNERIKDIKSGNGFIIKPPKGLKKDIRNQDGIYSFRFGAPSVMDADSFTDRYRCLCGEKISTLYEGDICPSCKTRVIYRGDNIKKTGWIVLNDKYHYIHPNLYWTISQFIGAEKLKRILNAEIKVNSDGNIINVTLIKKDEPFKGIGMMEFYNRFDEIIEYYNNKYTPSKPEKKIYYDDIKMYRNLIFTHSIAVFSSILRPIIEDNNGGLKYEECNQNFTMLNMLVATLNKDSLKIDQKSKERLKILYDIQCQINDLYEKIRDMLAKKKGDIRSAIGGRFCFTSRSVIKQDVNLKADQVKLPFAGLCELLQQVIINFLVKTNVCSSYAEARKRWYKCKISNNDPIIYNIIESYIKESDRGLPVLINRNPTIARGGILSCKVVGINNDYTMSISLLVLKLLAADFDGDTLNIMYLYNKDFIEIADEVLSPRQMFISNNDGYCNSDLLHSRDTIINANSLKSLYDYTEEEKIKIRKLQNII